MHIQKAMKFTFTQDQYTSYAETDYVTELVSYSGLIFPTSNCSVQVIINWGVKGLETRLVALEWPHLLIIFLLLLIIILLVISHLLLVILLLLLVILLLLLVILLNLITIACITTPLLKESVSRGLTITVKGILVD